jgi:hypothetical protein
MSKQNVEQNRTGDQAEDDEPPVDVAELLIHMENRRREGWFQELCCDMLMGEFNDIEPAGWPDVDIAKTIRLTVRATKDYPDSSSLISKAWYILFKLCSKVQANRVTFRKEGGFQSLVAAMRRHKENASLQEETCSFFQVALGHDNHEKVLNASVARDIAQAVANTILTHCAKHPNISKVCMGALFHLSAGYMEDIPKESSMEAMILGMRVCPKDFEVQMIACRVFSRLLMSGEAIAQKMWQKGVTTMILTAMDVMMSMEGGALALEYQHQLPDLLQQCINAICGIYESSAGSGSREEPGLNVIARAMATGTNLQHFLLQSDGMHAFYMTISNCKENGKHIGKKGVAAVLRGMKAHKHPDPTIQVRGMLALSVLCSTGAGFQEHLLQQPQIEFLLEQIQSRVNERDVQMAALMMFRGLAKDQGQHVLGLMVTRGCVKAIVQGLTRHSRKPDLVREGCAALADIVASSLSGEMRKLLLQQGAGDAVLRVMAANAVDAAVQYHGSRFLMGIMNRHPDIMLLLGRRAVPVVVSALLRHSEALSLGTLQRALGDYMTNFQTHHCDLRECDDHLREIANADAMRVFLNYLKTTPQSLGTTATVWADLALGVVGGLHMCMQQHRLNRDLFAEWGGIEELIRVMVAHKDEQVLCMCVCETLEAVSREHAKNMEKIVKLGGIRHIHRASDMKHVSPMCEAKMQYVKEILASRNAEAKQQLEALEIREKKKLAEACVVCCKSAAQLRQRRLSRCGACILAPTYCGEECQKAGWAAHKAECKANRKVSK